jgi:hypothetical protein
MLPFLSAPCYLGLVLSQSARATVVRGRFDSVKAGMQPSDFAALVDSIEGPGDYQDLISNYPIVDGLKLTDPLKRSTDLFVLIPSSPSPQSSLIVKQQATAEFLLVREKAGSGRAVVNVESGLELVTKGQLFYVGRRQLNPGGEPLPELPQNRAIQVNKEWFYHERHRISGGIQKKIPRPNRPGKHM